MKSVKGYEGIYEVSDQGDVYSVDRVVIGKDGTRYPKKGQRIIPFLNPQTGYLQVSLWKHNKGSNFNVHRLVAKAYVANPDNKPEINHINSVRSDPRAINLEWVTASENRQHGYDLGYMTQEHRRKLTEDDYKEVFKRFLSGEPFSKILKTYNVSPGRLSVNLRSYVEKWGQSEAYENERQRQRVKRAKINGSN